MQGLKEFVEVYNIMVGRSVVNAYRWDVPLLLVNSADHVVTIPAWTAIGQVESAAEIRKITKCLFIVAAVTSARPTGSCGTASLGCYAEFSDVELKRLRLSLSSHVGLFLTSGSPLVGRTTAITRELDTGSTKPIRCSPRRVSPKKIEIQNRLAKNTLRDGQTEPSDSPGSAPTVIQKVKNSVAGILIIGDYFGVDGHLIMMYAN